ncbi:MAG: HAMP domain-containing sensor histidine kinase [Myxococcota bacterium]
MTVSFRARILAGAVLTALLAVVLVWGSVTLTVERLVGRPEVDVPPVVLDACRAEPSSWEVLSFGAGELRFYDADGVSVSGVRVNGAEGLEVGGTRLVDHGEGRRSAFRRVAAEGPCATVEFTFGPGARMDTAFQLGGTLGVFLAVFAAGFATYRFTVLPLLVRIERIREAGVRVGATDYRSADDTVGDDLAAIAGVLDRSHTRIVEDRHALVDRQQALERYLAEIAHDLRTPLGSLVLALQEVDAVAGSEGREAARRALTDAAYVTTLVENLHQAARLRHGLDPTVGECDLAEIVRRVEVRFRAIGAARGVEVGASAVEGPVVVQCEPSLLERAVANLVHNATVHGAAHVAVLLEVDGDRFVLDVMDDGPGVPEVELADLAKRTFSDDPARRRGPGLGLAITNEVARRLGWSIEYGLGAEGGLAVRLSGPVVRPGLP